uniref:Uncharacterized protein n=1 Tax=Anguilla anguilla TaxID=7936 RepID=A0A0E9TW49_ANGAN
MILFATRFQFLLSVDWEYMRSKNGFACERASCVWVYVMQTI